MPTDAAGRAFLAQKAREPGVISRPSGLLYKFIERGTGTGNPLGDTPCDFHYRGNLIDGTEFDSSFKRGKPSEFTANGVVPGCTEGYQLMVEGDKVMFYIPSELAYGDQGVGDGLVPPGAVLVFEVHLVKIKGPTKPAVGQASAQPQFASAAQPQFAATSQPQFVSAAQPQLAYTTQPQTVAAQTITQPQTLAFAQPQAIAQPQAAVYSQQAYAQPVQYAQAQTLAQPVQYAQAQTLSQPVQYAQAQTIAQPLAYAQAPTSVQPMAYSQGQAYGQAQVMPGYRLA